MLNDGAIGRVLPVGGPRVENNLVTLKDAGLMMFDIHVAPSYGDRTLRGFMEKLKDREFPTGSYRERMRQGTNVMPTDI